MEFIQRFQIGLAPNAHGVFQKIMHEKKFSQEILLGAGLIAESSKGGYRDFFYDRITFPIHHTTGTMVGFSARKYKEETFGGIYIGNNASTNSTMSDNSHKIEEILLVTKNASNKMSNHIDFIDNIYDIIKKPFYKILSININIDKIKILR